MSTNSVKKYDVGSVFMNLPYKEYIHELPLITVSDLYQTVNLSLIYNNCNVESNDFNIQSGFKINLQKRLIFIGDKIYAQDEYGRKEEALLGENALESLKVYSFYDDSKRILIRTNHEVPIPDTDEITPVGPTYITNYTLEYPDESKEEYDSLGKLKKIYNKYGEVIFEYIYNLSNILTSIIYRNTKKFVFSYTNNQVTNIKYYYNNTLVCSNSISYQNNKIIISHYSGVNYNVEFLENRYYVYSMENSNVVKSIEVNKSLDNKNFEILEKNYGEIVDSKKFYSDSWDDSKSYCNYVDITDHYGVIQRIQYSGLKEFCSYEIGSAGPEFIGNIFYGNIKTKRIENNINEKNQIVRDHNNGLSLSNLEKENNPFHWEIHSPYSLNQEGYYIISGWCKVNDAENFYGYFDVGNFLEFFKINPTMEGKWKYFSFEFYYSGDFDLIFSGYNVELNDLRIFFQNTSTKENGNDYSAKLPELVCINKNTNEVIPIKYDTIYNEDLYLSIEENFTLSDLFKYKKDKRNGNGRSYVYYNDCKNIIHSIYDLLVYHNGTEDNLNNYYIGQRYYNASKEYLSKIIIEESLNVPIRVEKYVNGQLIGYSEYTEKMDKILECQDNVTKRYDYSNGMIILDRCDNLYTRTITYSADSEDNILITSIDEFNTTNIQVIDPIWGKVKKVLSNNQVLFENSYDQNKIALINKKFNDNNVLREIDLNYHNDNLSFIKTNSLKYVFTYEKNNLVEVYRISGNNDEEVLSITEQHSYIDDNLGNTIINSSHPTSQVPLYTKSETYNKYRQLVKINNLKEYTYDLDPYANYVELEGIYLCNIIGLNGLGAKLASSKDLTTNQTSNYYYEYNNLKFIKRLDSNSQLIMREKFNYDDINRLTNEIITYNNKTISIDIEYLYNDNSHKADNRIKKYTFDAGKILVTENTYDTYKRITSKKYTMNEKEYNCSLTYYKTRLDTFTNEDRNYLFLYDNLNRITTISTNGKIISYKYDNFGQLIRENNQELNKTNIYEYDNLGNITFVKEYPYTPAAQEISDDVINTQSFLYENTLFPDRLTKYNGVSIPYDQNGYMTKVNGFDLIWSNGKLTSATSGNSTIGFKKNFFTYNGDGQRTNKRYSFVVKNIQNVIYYPGQLLSQNNNYLYDENGRLLSETIVSTYYQSTTTTETLEYLYDENKIVGIVYNSNDIFYLQRNVNNDVIGIIDINGTKLVEYIYDAWGNCTIINPTNSRIGTINPIRYRGYYYDVETNLFLVTSRYYSPELGRFIQPADVSSLNPSSINGLNLYSYANNNPIGIAYSSSSARGATGGRIMSSLSLGGTISGGAMSGVGVGSSTSISRNMPPVPGWIKTASSIADPLTSFVGPIRTAIYAFTTTDLWDLMRLDGVDELPGILSKSMKIAGYRLAIFNAGVVGYEKYASGASNISALAGAGINACIGIGSIHVSTLAGSFAVGLLSATALSGGWIILLSAGAAFIAGTATNHLLTKLEIGGNTIEGHLNDFIDWLIWWD